MKAWMYGVIVAHLCATVAMAGPSSLPLLAAKKSPLPAVTISKSRSPDAARHIEDAQKHGQPSVLTIDRKGAKQNRKDSLAGIPLKPGKDRDEYPPAMFQEGGAGASVRHINSSDNRSSGSCVGAQCRKLPDGAKVKIKVAP